MSERLFPSPELGVDAALEADLIIIWGGGGHEGEYQVNLPTPGRPPIDDIRIPERIVVDLQNRLGQSWWVSNRGSRIEINSQPNPGLRDDTFVVNSLTGYFDELRQLKIS